jgi:hypothetical protein
MEYDPERLATDIRALAVRARGVIAGSSPDVDELCAVADRAAELRNGLDGSPRGTIHRWLEAIESEATARAGAARRWDAPHPDGGGVRHTVTPIPDPACGASRGMVAVGRADVASRN